MENIKEIKMQLDLIALKNMVEMFPTVLARLAHLENQVGIYEKSYEVKMLNPQQFMVGIGITRNTFENWKRAGVFSYNQKDKGKEVSIPATEIDRINDLCKDIPKKNRLEYLLNLKTNHTINI
jgi:hypothetical protein